MHVTTSSGGRFRSMGTRLQRSHRKLAETRRRVRELLEDARLASWEWHPDSGEIVFSDVLNAYTTHTRASLDGLLGALPAAEREGARDDFDAFVRGDREEVVRRHRSPGVNGSTMLLEIRARAVRDEEGALVCVRGVAQQASAGETGMGELLRARDFFQGTLDSLPAHIAVLDERGAIIMTNRAWSTFASANHAGAAVGIGANYLTACDQAIDDELASRAADALRAIIGETLSLITRVREALAEDRFVLYAQPIIDVCSGEVVQRELLLRIREPSGEIVIPSSFLPVAEEYGLIGDIDRWVIARASEIAAASGAVELNISAHSMSDRTILDHIERCLRRTGADPTHLVFEVTETALVADQAAAVAFASRLHALGCKLALDDFGTGYGGFTYLKRFPVDFLKIDVEFVRDLSTNPASRHVVEAVATLARAFDLKTVAEGVEDAATLALLRELGVEFAQGYHIARPQATDGLQDSEQLV
jgi:EAL domain-containing protein (putative c-di-GMP-specific phosphodiesterase class I)